MVESVNCERCGSTGVFLRKKGPAVGLYCLGCGKWYKWLGKKVVEAYKHRGYKVNNEDWTPDGDSTQSAPSQSQSNPSKPVNTTNSHLAGFGKPLSQEDPVDYEEDFLPSTNALKKKSESSLYKDSNPRAYGVAEEEQVNPKAYSNFDPCLVCVSGVIDPMSKGQKAKLRIFEGVMTVVNTNDTETYGSFKIKHCPNCGKKL